MNLQSLRLDLRAYSKNGQLTDAECDRAVDGARVRIGNGLRHPTLLEMVELVPATNGMALPARFAAARSLVVDGIEVRQVIPTQFSRMRTAPRGPRSAGAWPMPYFCCIGSQLALSNDGELGELLCYRAPAELIQPDDSNANMDQYPTLWRQAALVELYQYLQEDAPGQIAAQAFSALLDDANVQGQAAEWNQSVSQL